MIVLEREPDKLIPNIDRYKTASLALYVLPYYFLLQSY